MKKEINPEIEKFLKKVGMTANKNNYEFIYGVVRDDTYGITIYTFTHADQPFGLQVEVTIPPTDTLLEATGRIAMALWEEADMTDISHETYKRLNREGHGTGGAPYDMKECYEDIERCVNSIKTLSGIIRNVGND